MDPKPKRRKILVSREIKALSIVAHVGLLGAPDLADYVPKPEFEQMKRQMEHYKALTELQMILYAFDLAGRDRFGNRCPGTLGHYLLRYIDTDPVTGADLRDPITHKLKRRTAPMLYPDADVIRAMTRKVYEGGVSWRAVLQRARSEGLRVCEEGGKVWYA